MSMSGRDTSSSSSRQQTAMSSKPNILVSLRNFVHRRPVQVRIDELRPSRDWHMIVVVGIVLSLSLIALDVLYMLDVTSSSNNALDTVQRGTTDQTQFEQTVALFKGREAEFTTLRQTAPTAPTTSRIPPTRTTLPVVGTSTGSSSVLYVQ